MNTWITCSDCNGTGKDVVGWGPYTAVVDCLTCHGAGKIPLEKPMSPGPTSWKVKNLPNGDFEIVRTIRTK